MRTGRLDCYAHFQATARPFCPSANRDPVTAYSLALTFHLLSVLLAVAAASLANFASLRLRRAEGAADAEAWLGVIHKVVLIFSRSWGCLPPAGT